MPTVECQNRDCEKHGIDVCIAARVRWGEGRCMDYRPRVGKGMMEQPFKANCIRSGGRYKSSRVTGILK